MTDELTTDPMADSVDRLCAVRLGEHSLDELLELITSLAVESLGASSAEVAPVPNGELSAPLLVDGVETSVLNVHLDGSQSPTEQQRQHLRRLAEQASVVLTNAVAFAQAERVNDQLEDALVTRESIGQAKGIIMARQGVGSREAFEILRGSSQQSNRKLREVAQEIVDSVETANA